MAGIPLSDLSVLIVDDSHNFLSVMRALLRACGVRSVHQSSSASHALESSRFFLADVILLDLAMPQMDGIEFLRTLRESEENPNRHTPVIFVSAHASRERVQEALKAGAHGFIVKPVAPRTLKEWLTHIAQDDREIVVL